MARRSRAADGTRVYQARHCVTRHRPALLAEGTPSPPHLPAADKCPIEAGGRSPERLGPVYGRFRGWCTTCSWSQRSHACQIRRDLCTVGTPSGCRVGGERVLTMALRQLARTTCAGVMRPTQAPVWNHIAPAWQVAPAWQHGAGVQSVSMSTTSAEGATAHVTPEERAQLLEASRRIFGHLPPRWVAGMLVLRPPCAAAAAAAAAASVATAAGSHDIRYAAAASAGHRRPAPTSAQHPR